MHETQPGEMRNVIKDQVISSTQCYLYTNKSNNRIGIAAYLSNLCKDYRMRQPICFVFEESGQQLESSRNSLDSFTEKKKSELHTTTDTLNRTHYWTWPTKLTNESKTNQRKKEEKKKRFEWWNQKASWTEIDFNNTWSLFDCPFHFVWAFFFSLSNH